MARPLRIEFPGALYHVTARGNARSEIYLGDGDRLLFLSILADLVERYNWICHGYCLMGNHYHLLIETPDGNLSEGMRQLNGIYTQKFNRTHGRVGHVFCQGRFKSIVVDKDSHLLELCRYVVLNPVRAGMARHPKDYPWSSYCATAGLKKKLGLLTSDWILSQFGNDRQKAQQEYRKFVLAGISEESPWKKLVGQCLLGAESFLEKLSPFLREKAVFTEIPRVQRFALRPSLEVLLPERQSKPSRNKAIAAAHIDHGYSQQSIAAHLGLHYATVSRIIKKERNTSKNKT
ncbi:REP element-mobilizing transposase RayT [Desulfonatronum thiosulfatophilum]|uniref:REP element-mobilizing transposase RayT n=1 Tax=Desulfonatronum thiosulfatophilum TaxID=617002 RepID=A0A1G6EEH8_9BACT|nr:transposase [Desulfonatronum thiosulfatophilum]SDB55897.1 REP element-mobilizing transposase RayT [Desulfonatronum thiosulfatophilum]